MFVIAVGMSERIVFVSAAMTVVKILLFVSFFLVFFGIGIYVPVLFETFRFFWSSVIYECQRVW